MPKNNNITVNNEELLSENTSETYSKIRNGVIIAQSNTYSVVNSAMVQTGKSESRFILLAVKTNVLSIVKAYSSISLKN